jgi:hypothetical protein
VEPLNTFNIPKVLQLRGVRINGSTYAIVIGSEHPKRLALMREELKIMDSYHGD